MPADKSTKLDYVIDADSPDGVVLGDGDGTVSLLTHTMCHEWQKVINQDTILLMSICHHC